MTRAVHIHHLNNDSNLLQTLFETNEQYLIFFPRSGKGHLQQGFKQHVIQSQRVFLLSPGPQPRQIQWQGSGALISFEPWLLRSFFKQYPDERLLPLFRPGKKNYADVFPATSAALQMLITLITRENSQPAQARILHSYISTFLLHLANAFRLVNHLAGKRPHHLTVERLYRLITEHYRVRRLPAYYANELGLPVRKLNEQCKLATGKLVAELISEELLAEAERLLFEQELSIKEIAYELEFADMAQFNHFMKRHTGLSPTEFRQQFQADNGSGIAGQAASPDGG